MGEQDRSRVMSNYLGGLKAIVAMDVADTFFSFPNLAEFGTSRQLII